MLYWHLLVCAWEDQSKNQYSISHKTLHVLYSKYSTVVSKYSTVTLIIVCYGCSKQPLLPAYVASCHALYGFTKVFNNNIYNLGHLIHVEQSFLQHKHRTKLNYQNTVASKLNEYLAKSMYHGALSNNPIFIQCRI